MYKVLDIRELVKTDYCAGSSDSYSNNIKLNTYSVAYIIVICEHVESKERCRFEFYEGRELKDFMGNRYYRGYKGDFRLLVNGDLFEVQVKNNDYDRVKLLN